MVALGNAPKATKVRITRKWGWLGDPGKLLKMYADSPNFYLSQKIIFSGRKAEITRRSQNGGNQAASVRLSIY